MTPTQFENDHAETWQRLEGMIEQIEKGKPVPDAEEMPTLFRQVCHDLSLAQHRMFGRVLVDRLNALAILGYRVLERRSSGGWERLWQIISKSSLRPCARSGGSSGFAALAKDAEGQQVIAKLPGIRPELRHQTVRLAASPAKVHLFANGQSLLYR